MDERKTHLDFVRGMAAVAVSLSHLRNFFFVDYSQVINPNLFDKFFYFITGFGHAAVMIFFVLSGYFIGGAVYTRIKEHRWSWVDYGISRLARLWTVLIPALLLTLMWDFLGMHLHGIGGYDGRFGDLIHSGPNALAPINLSVSCFLGNVFFLQTIKCPIFGTNGPLWSLAYEFWYYLLFPLAFFMVVHYDTFKRRVLAGIIFCIIFLFLPKIILVDGIIWLMGFFSFYICGLNNLAKTIVKHPFFFILALFLFISSMLIARKEHSNYSDCYIGIAFTCMMPFLSVNQSNIAIYKWISEKLSSISYTLYLVHFPILGFIFFVYRLPNRSQPTIGNIIFCLFLYSTILIYGWFVWFFFENKTPMVRTFIKENIFKSECNYL